MTDYNAHGVIVLEKIGTSVYDIERIYSAELTVSASHVLAQNATENFVLIVDHRKIALIIFDVTAVGAGTAVLTLKIQYQDPVTAKWVTVKTITPAAGFIGTDLLQVGLASWPADASPLYYLVGALPPNSRCRINASMSNNAGDSATYSVGMVQMEAW